MTGIFAFINSSADLPPAHSFAKMDHGIRGNKNKVHKQAKYRARVVNATLQYQQKHRKCL
jgi:hypothetical protein